MKRIHLLAFFVFVFCALSAQDKISIEYGPYLQNVEEHEVSIVWKSSRESVGWVEIAPDDGTNFYEKERTRYFDTANGLKNVSSVHSVRISGLDSGTTYRYRVYSQEVLSHKGIQVTYGSVAATDVYRKKPLEFTTNSKSVENFSFVVVNDIHGRSDDMVTLLKAAGYEKSAFVVFNGDMVSEFKDEEHIFNGFMSDAVDLFAKEKPLYYVRGNHETRGEYASSFQDYFCPEKPSLYFTVSYGPAFFICLDTGEDKPDSDIEYSGITAYDGYRSVEAEWLKSVVVSDEFRNAQYRIVLCHMPPVSSEGGIWHGGKEVLDKFVPILNGRDVSVMFCGHAHSYSYHNPSDLIDFPVLVNDDETVLRVDVSEDEMTMNVVDKAGKTVQMEKVGHCHKF